MDHIVTEKHVITLDRMELEQLLVDALRDKFPEIPNSIATPRWTPGTTAPYSVTVTFEEKPHENT